MNYSALFHKIKHESYKANRSEIAAVRAFLEDDSTLDMPEAHAAIYVLCLSAPPSKGDIGIVKKYLGAVVDDYAKAAAIRNLVETWNVFDDDIQAFVKFQLAKLDPTGIDTLGASFSACIHIYKSINVIDLIILARRSYCDALEKYESGLRDYGECVVSFTNSIFIEARERGWTASTVFSVKEAVSSSRSAITYLDRILDLESMRR